MNFDKFERDAPICSLYQPWEPIMPPFFTLIKHLLVLAHVILLRILLSKIFWSIWYGEMITFFLSCYGVLVLKNHFYRFLDITDHKNYYDPEERRSGEEYGRVSYYLTTQMLCDFFDVIIC